MSIDFNICLNKENQDQVKVYKLYMEIGHLYKSFKAFCTDNNLDYSKASNIHSKFSNLHGRFKISIREAGENSIYLVPEISNNDAQKLILATGIHDIHKLHIFHFLNKDAYQYQKSLAATLFKRIDKYFSSLPSPISEEDRNRLKPNRVRYESELFHYYGPVSPEKISEKPNIEYGYIADFLEHALEIWKKIPWINLYIDQFMSLRISDLTSINPDEYFCNFRISDGENPRIVCDFLQVRKQRYDITIELERKTNKLHFFYSIAGGVGDNIFYYNELDKYFLSILDNMVYRCIYLKNLFIYLDKMLDGDTGYETALGIILKYPGIPLTHPNLVDHFCNAVAVITTPRGMKLINSRNKDYSSFDLITPERYYGKFANTVHTQYWVDFPEFKKDWKLYTDKEYIPRDQYFWTEGMHNSYEKLFTIYL